MGDGLGEELLSPCNFINKNNYLIEKSGGSIGIRTLETVPRLHTFQACAFDHSATDPLAVFSLPLSQGARGEADRDRGKRTLLQIVLDSVAFDGVPHTEGNTQQSKSQVVVGCNQSETDGLQPAKAVRV